MADSTINGLTALAAASVTPGTDVAPVWQGSASTTKKVTIADLVTAGNTFGTITASSPATITQTWSNVAVTFTGALLNVTDTASAATSLLQDWQVGGTSQAKIKKDGSFGGNTLASFTTGAYISQATALAYISSGSVLGRCLSSGGNIGGAKGVIVDAASVYCWSSLTASASVDGGNGANSDLFLYRDAAATLAQRNGVNAQGFRVYNTYTDALNYERGVFDWQTTANTLTIGTVAAGTGTLRAVQLIGSNATVSASAGGFVAFATNSTNRWYVNSSGGFVAFVDNTYDFGGISTNRCKSAYFSSSVKITGATSALEAWNTDAATSTTNYEKGVFDWATTANTLTIGTVAAGTGTLRDVTLTGANLRINATTNTYFQIAASPVVQLTSTVLQSYTDGVISLGVGISSGRFNNGFFKTSAKITGAASVIEAWNTDAAVSTVNYEKGVFDWATTANTLTIGSAKGGTGVSRAVNFIAGGVTAMTLGTAGDVQIPKTVTAAGTTGAQTINKQSGTVNFAAAATSLVVTNSFVTTSSVITATVGTNDSTMKTVSVVAAAGSFTLFANAAATAETRVNFHVLN